MRMITLPSKSLAAIGFNPYSHDLVAQFAKNGLYYHYSGVEDGVFISIITDPDSHGKAFDRHIRKHAYPYRQVTAEEVAHL